MSNSLTYFSERYAWSILIPPPVGVDFCAKFRSGIMPGMVPAVNPFKDVRFSENMAAALELKTKVGQLLTDDEKKSWPWLSNDILWLKVEQDKSTHYGKTFFEVLVRHFSYGYWLLRPKSEENGAGLPESEAVHPKRARQALSLQAFQILALSIPAYANAAGRLHQGDSGPRTYREHYMWRVKMATDKGCSLYKEYENFTKQVDLVAETGAQFAKVLGKEAVLFPPQEKILNYLDSLKTQVAEPAQADVVPEAPAPGPAAQLDDPEAPAPGPAAPPPEPAAPREKPEPIVTPEKFKNIAEARRYCLLVGNGCSGY